jgi:tyrosine phenol-lyase
MLPSIEPFRIKSVEPIYQTTRLERERLLHAANYNLYRIDAQKVVIDLLTDSGLSALSVTQCAAMMQGDESYAGSASFRRFERVVRQIFGFEFILPTHQGRAAERLLLQSLGSDRSLVPSNAHFDTTRANTISLGMEPADLPADEFWDFDEPHPFKGNMNTEALEQLLKRSSARVPFILLTMTNNLYGDQPVSMANLRRTHQIASSFGIPLYLDACRFAQNAWFIRQRETGYQNADVRAIVSEMCSYVDGCIFSAKKDGLGHMGGFLATRSATVAARAQEHLLLSEGYLTYGGMTGRDLEIVATGLEEVLLHDYLDHRIETTKYLWTLLKQEGVPVLNPPGGHAVYVDVNRLLPHLAKAENPGQRLASEIYLEAGIRTTRMTLPPRSYLSCHHQHQEFVRLAIPSRVYSTNHLQYAAKAVGNVARRAGSMPGLRTVSSNPQLSGFLAQFECVKSNPEKTIDHSVRSHNFHKNSKV